MTFFETSNFLACMRWLSERRRRQRPNKKIVFFRCILATVQYVHGLGLFTTPPLLVVRYNKWTTRQKQATSGIVRGASTNSGERTHAKGQSDVAIKLFRTKSIWNKSFCYRISLFSKFTVLIIILRGADFCVKK